MKSLGIGPEIQGWQGSCAGMTMTSIMFKQGSFSYDYGWWNTSDSSSQIQTTYGLTDIRDNKNLKYGINFYQNLQDFMEMQMEDVTNGEVTPGSAVETLNEYYDKEENSENVLYTYFGYIGRQHAVVITGKPEKIENGFFESIYNEMDVEEKDFYNKNKNAYNSFTGGWRIPIYGASGVPGNNVEERKSLAQKYIYIPSSCSNVIIREGNSFSYYGANISIKKINGEKIFNLEEFLKNEDDTAKISVEFDLNTSDFTPIFGFLGTEILVTNENGESSYIKKGEKQDGTLIEKVVGEKYAESNENEKQKVTMFAKASNKYSIEPKNANEELDAAIQLDGSFMTVNANKGAKATFEKQKTVEIENPSGEKCYLGLTLDDKYTDSPWYTTMASVEDAKKIKLEKKDEGIVASGDNLKKLLINGSNKENTLLLDASTDKDKVLIKTADDKSKLLACVDNNADGTFETVIAESTVVKAEKQNNALAQTVLSNNKKQDNTTIPEKLPNAGIGSVVIIICIVILILLAIFFGKNSFKKY